MDPNKCLDDIRLMLTLHYSGIATESDYSDLSESVSALDEWLSKGGFMPAPWQESRPAHWQDVLASTNAKAHIKGIEDAIEALDDLIVYHKS